MRDLLQRCFELLSELWGLSDVIAAVQVAYRAFSWDLPLRAVLALALVASMLTASLRLTHVLLPRGSIPLRWGTVAASGMWLSTVGFHLLRSLHAFTWLGAFGACLLLAAASLWLLPQRVALGVCLRRERRAARALLRCVRRDSRLLLGFFALSACALIVRALIIPPLGWDTLTYHGPRAVRWLQSGELTFEPGTGPYDYYRHFFSGGEIFMAWAMLPLHSDLLVNLGGAAQWLSLGLASWAFARELRLGEPFATSTACAVMFAPLVQLQVCSGYVELPLNAALVQGSALAVHVMRRPTPGAAIACAMSLGVAAGVKLQGATPGLIMGVGALVRLLLSSGAVPQRILAAVSGMACAVLPALPWLHRAYRDTGYPLSPMPVQLGPLTLGVASPMMRWYQARNLTPGDWEAEKNAALRMLAPLGDFHATLGSMALFPFVLAPLGLIVLARRRPLLALLLSVTAALPVLAHFSAGLSAVRLLRVGSAARFLITAWVQCVPLSLLCAQHAGLAGRAYRVWLLFYPVTYTLLSLRDGQAPWELRDALCCAVLIAWAVLLLRALPHRLAFCAALLVLGLCSLQLRRDQTRFSAYRHSFAIHNAPRYWADAVRQVDLPDRAHRIAVTGGPDQSSDRWQSYFFLGTRLQNSAYYVTPTRDGGIAHYGPGGDLEARADYSAWLKRLHSARITHVVSFQPRSLEQSWMNGHGEHFEKLAGDAQWGLFALHAR